MKCGSSGSSSVLASQSLIKFLEINIRSKRRRIDVDAPSLPAADKNFPRTAGIESV